MNTRHLIILCFSFLICFKGRAQQTYGGIPYTSVINTTNPDLESYRSISQEIATVTLPDFNNSDLQEIADNETEKPDENFYGVPLTQSRNIIAEGTYDEVDGIRIYRYKFNSNTAKALQFSFSTFNLPEGGELYFYNTDKTMFFGALTSGNNPEKKPEEGHTALIMSALKSGDWILEYNEPVTASFRGELTVREVIHVFNERFADIAQDPQCQIDASCPDGDEWDIEKKSTVHITYTNLQIFVPNSTYGMVATATGNLINSTNDNENGPYLLSAGHVFLGANNQPIADMRDVYFRYNVIKDGCYNDGTGNHLKSNARFSTGAVMLKAKYVENSYDYALMRLSLSPQTIAKYDICYAGWDNRPDLDPMAYPYMMFHHPNGLDKKLAQTPDDLLESVVGISDPVDPSGKFWRTLWDEGAPAKGSDGASIFDLNKRIVGTLSSKGTAACISQNGGYAYNNLPSRFSKFSASYADGNFVNYLDPINSQANTCPPYCPVVDPENEVDPSVTNTGAMKFNINGHETGNRVMQVCADHLVLTSPTTFHLTKSAQERLCSNISDAASAAQNGQACYLGICTCEAKFRRIFVKIQEYDSNFWNTIGGDHSQWFFIFDGDINTVNEDLMNTLDLSVYAPQGFQLQEGKNYKILLGGIKDDVQPDQWLEYSSLITTLAQNLNLQSEYITTTKTAVHNIEVSGNSFIPANLSPDINIVAGDQIHVTGEADFNSGKFLIDDMNCSNVNNYRPLIADSVLEAAGAYQQDETNNLSPIKNPQLGMPAKTRKNDQNIISVYPNPSTGNFNISLNLSKTSSVSARLENVDGKEIKDCFNYTNQNGNQVYNIYTDNINAGIYILKLKINGKPYNYKLIKIEN